MPTSAPTGPAPRLPNGKPDFTGVWQRAYVPDMSRNGRGQQGYAEAPFAPGDPPARRDELRKAGNYAELPFTPAGLDDWKTYDPANGDYTGSCLPFGMSRSMNSPDPMQIMQSDKYIALLFEQNTWFHVIHMDGREHPEEPRADLVRPLRRQVGRRHARRRHRSASTATRASTPSAIRTATRCT